MYYKALKGPILFTIKKATFYWQENYDILDKKMAWLKPTQSEKK